MGTTEGRWVLIALLSVTVKGNPLYLLRGTTNIQIGVTRGVAKIFVKKMGRRPFFSGFGRIRRFTNIVNGRTAMFPIRPNIVNNLMSKSRVPNKMFLTNLKGRALKSSRGNSSLILRSGKVTPTSNGCETAIVLSNRNTFAIKRPLPNRRVLTASRHRILSVLVTINRATNVVRRQLSQKIGSCYTIVRSIFPRFFVQWRDRKRPLPVGRIAKTSINGSAT